MEYKPGDIVVWHNGSIGKLRQIIENISESKEGKLWRIGFTIANEGVQYQSGQWREGNFRHAKNSEVEQYLKGTKER